MTEQEINAAIAEACGWSEIRRTIEDNYHDLPTDTLGFLMGTVSGLRPGKIHIENSEPLPDYCNDLNAMHEAEMEMNVEQQKKYVWKLVHDFSNDSFGWDGELGHEGHWALVHATARQRAEAFMKTIGEWKEQTNDN